MEGRKEQETSISGYVVPVSMNQAERKAGSMGAGSECENVSAKERKIRARTVM